MAETKKLSGAGLRGQSAGQTALCTVGKTGTGLTYRGYDISELAEGATFEEVAYLILYGELPNKKQLDAYKAKLKKLRGLPKSVKDVLERIPKSDASDGRDAHRLFDSRQRRARGRLQSAARRGRSTARRRCPSIINYWYRFSHDGVRIETETDEDSLAGHFLHLLHGKSPSELQQRVMDVSLILYAEHEFNASTFTARVCASTLSDMHSCVTGAIGSLRGPLHGGANEAAMEMIEKFSSPATRRPASRACWSAKTRSWDSVTRSTPRPIRATRSSRRGRRSSRSPLATRFCSRSRSPSKRRCGTKRSCSRTPTSTTRPPTTSWAFRRSCSRRSSSVRACRAGPPTSWNSVPTIASSGRARTMLVRRRAPSSNCQIDNRRKRAT